MATNKQPMLIDRPLRTSITLGGVSCLGVAGDWNSPAPAGLTLLCSGGTEGALIDSSSVLMTQASTSLVNVLLFISDQASPQLISAANTRLITWALLAGTTPGSRTTVPLPLLLAPVPNLASPAATIATYPSESDKKNTGIFLESTQYIYAGVDVAITTPATSTRVILGAQGGYY
jgi:hypothetical protein